jgi:hypothetical protein
MAILWIQYGHVMGSWTHLDLSFIPSTSKVASNVGPSPHRKDGHFETVFVIIHGSNGQYLLNP